MRGAGMDFEDLFVCIFNFHLPAIALAQARRAGTKLKIPIRHIKGGQDRFAKGGGTVVGGRENNYPLWGSQALKKGFVNLYSSSLSKRMLSLISRVIALFTVDGLLKPADFMNETEKTFFPPSIAMAMRHLS